MKQKIIDLDKTVYTLCSTDLELASTLAQLGFTEIVKPIMLQTVGKVMTIAKGASLRGLDLQEIIRGLEKQGYTVLQKEQEEHA